MIGLFLIVTVGLILLASWFISNKVYKTLQKRENHYSMLFSVLTFIGSFAVIGFAILVLILYNVKLER
jgi:uncharacterized BrkB/YihY/UPF0761 family membrane protein